MSPISPILVVRNEGTFPKCSGIPMVPELIMVLLLLCAGFFRPSESRTLKSAPFEMGLGEGVGPLLLEEASHLPHFFHSQASMPQALCLSRSLKVDTGAGLVIDTSRVTERDQPVRHRGIRHVAESACADDLACVHAGANSSSHQRMIPARQRGEQLSGHEQCRGELVRLLFHQWFERPSRHDAGVFCVTFGR